MKNRNSSSAGSAKRKRKCKKWEELPYDRTNTPCTKRKASRQMATSCESCGNFVYDEEYECYTCEVDLDEDEMARFLQDKFYDCPYYQLGDEYRIVRKQM